MSERDIFDILNGEPENLLDLTVSDFDTDEEITAKIRRYILAEATLPSGYRPLPNHLKPFLLKILELGQFTPHEFRQAGFGKHPWQRKLDLGKFVPISDEDRTVDSDAIYRIDFSEIRKMGCILRKPKHIDLLTKRERRAICKEHDDRCSFCGGSLQKLQIDHGVPHEINGDNTHYLVACPSCNRKKGHVCKSCPNFMTSRNPEVCYSETEKCLWACRFGEAHTHVATRPERQVQIALTAPEDIHLFDTARGVDLRAALLRGLQSR